MFTFVGCYITGDILFMQNCWLQSYNILFIFLKPAALILLVIFFFLSKNANLWLQNVLQFLCLSVYMQYNEAVRDIIGSLKFLA